MAYECQIKYPDSDKIICSINQINKTLDDIKSKKQNIIYAIILQPKNTKLDPVLKIGYSKSVNEFLYRRFPAHQYGFGNEYNLYLYNVYPVKGKIYETMLHKSIKKNNPDWNKRIMYQENSFVSLTIETYRLGQKILKYIPEKITDIEHYLNEKKNQENILDPGDYININNLIDSGKITILQKSNDKKRKRDDDLFIIPQ